MIDDILATLKIKQTLEEKPNSNFLEILIQVLRYQKINICSKSLVLNTLHLAHQIVNFDDKSPHFFKVTYIL